MSGMMTHEFHETATNPLDVLEQILSANEWACERQSDGEMVAEAPGKWGHYAMFFSWAREISAMHFSCAFDIKVPAGRRGALYELLALANERLWIGHFGIETDDGVPRCSATPCCCAARRAPVRRAWRTWSISH